MGEQSKVQAELEVLKANIGFGTAFKATLGFYTAQFLAQTIGLLVVGGIIIGVVYLLK